MASEEARVAGVPEESTPAFGSAPASSSHRAISTSSLTDADISAEPCGHSRLSDSVGSAPWSSRQRTISRLPRSTAADRGRFCSDSPSFTTAGFASTKARTAFKSPRAAASVGLSAAPASMRALRRATPPFPNDQYWFLQQA